MEQLSALLDVVLTAKQSVDLLEGYLLSLGDAEEDEGGEEDIDSHEEEEAAQARVV